MAGELIRSERDTDLGEKRKERPKSQVQLWEGGHPRMQV